MGEAGKESGKEGKRKKRGGGREGVINTGGHGRRDSKRLNTQTLLAFTD